MKKKSPLQKKKSGSFSDQPPLQGESETWIGRSQWWSWSSASGTRSSSEWPAGQGGPGSPSPGGTAAADGQGGRRGTASTDTVRTAGGPVQVRHSSWSMLVVSAMASILSNWVSLLPCIDLLGYLLHVWVLVSTVELHIFEIGCRNFLIRKV
jgi:hypothetical protein